MQMPGNRHAVLGCWKRCHFSYRNMCERANSPFINDGCSWFDAQLASIAPRSTALPGVSSNIRNQRS
jgi:hypothetical protein